MTRPLRIQYPGAFYHVFSRGNERKDIFLADDDRNLFLAILEECSKRFDVRIHSYCLMDNHTHILLETKNPNLSNFMKRLLGVYTLRFNRIHKRAGHLFQGRYKGYLVEKDAYLLELSRYTHLNPVRARMAQTPEAYPWSSMKYYLSKESPEFIERSFLLGLFATTQDYHRFVIEGLKDQTDLFKKAIGGLILGSREFADTFRDKSVKEEGIPGKRQLTEMPIDILMELAEFEDPDIQIYNLWKIGKKTQKEIARLFGKTDSAVSHAIRRVEARLNQNGILKAKTEELEQAISCFKN